jgi:pimeloyl-ACP methyl ester carboxylesterase
MPELLNDGLSLHYEVHGSGWPVVLLHGGTVSFARNFARYGWIERCNERGMQVIGLDFRGHGKSAKPHDVESYGTRHLAGDVLALLAHLHLDRVGLVGYSIGSVIALHLLHAHPERFCAAALVAAGDGLLGFPPHTLASVVPQLATVLGRTALPRELPAHLAAYRTFVTESGGDWQALAALARASYPPLAPEQAAAIEVPVLVISGERDPVLGRGPRLAQALACGRYREAAGADHFALAADEATQRAVAEFLAGASWSGRHG